MLIGRDVPYYTKLFPPNTTLDTFIHVMGPRIRGFCCFFYQKISFFIIEYYYGTKLGAYQNSIKAERHVRPQSQFCDLQKTSHLYHVICAENFGPEVWIIILLIIMT